jgi:hypothetical protein
LARSDHDRDIPCVQGHVAPLDPLGGQRPQRAEVLRETDRPDDLSHLDGGLDPEDLQSNLGNGVDFRRSPHKADGHGHLQRPDEIPLAVLLP